MLVQMLKALFRPRRRVAAAGEPATKLLARLDILRKLMRDGDRARAAELANIAFGANFMTLLALSRTGELEEAVRGYIEVLRSGLDGRPAARAWEELGYGHSLRGEVEQSVQAYREGLRHRSGGGPGYGAFDDLYHRGLAMTQTPDAAGRRARFFRLVSLAEQCARLEGDLAECGCWRGLSSYLVCSTLRRLDPSMTGRGYHVFDSFEGLSQPGELDGGAGSAGQFAISLEEVRRNLAAFPDIAYHPGWLPASLAGLPERRYRFVHVDVDLFEPTDGAIRYFVPRLVSGGLLVCDDYNWPGARKAIDDYVRETGVSCTTTDTHQAVMRAA
jgi:hypothetical protein